jgi:hypothetical protein
MVRQGDDGNNITLSVPTALKDYNKYKGGVDTLDQRLSYYSLPRKSRRWWPRLAWWLIDVAIANAHRLYQIQIDPNCTGMAFRLKLMHELAGDVAPTPAVVQRKRRTSDPSTCPSHHLLQSNDRHDCSMCSRPSAHRKQTRFFCDECQVFVCPVPCYDVHREEQQ